MEVSISTLRLDYTLHIRMSWAHAKLERCRFANYPVVNGFCRIDATAFDCWIQVKRPEYPATHERFGKLNRVKCRLLLILARTYRAMEMKVDWSATRMPGHMRRPNPKGIMKSLSTLPFQFPTGLCGVRNREGLNDSGSSNTFGSLARTLSHLYCSVRWHESC